MKADDVRHGTVAGYRAGCRGASCKKAISQYNERRKIRLNRGEPTTTLIPATGTQRRLQALGALGWSLTAIGAHTGIHRTYLRFLLRNNQRVTTSLAYEINKAYEELCMTLPPTTTPGERQGVTRTRKRAAQLGWLPPLAWDDIDTDLSATFGDETNDLHADQILIDRVLAGDATSARSATPIERAAVINLWAGPLAELERMTGWNVHREIKKCAA